MKRKSGRFIDRPSAQDQDDSSGVSVVVNVDRRRTASIGWRYLGLAIVTATAAAVILLASLASEGHRIGSASAPSTASARLPASERTSPSSCVRAPGYGGLGARLSAFDPNNNSSSGPAGPSPGTAFYTATATARGCVSAFSVQDGASPPLSARDLLLLVSRPYLPGDVKPVVRERGCAVWKSRALRRATGRAYAQATAIAQAGSLPGTAQIEATSSPAC